MDIIRVPFGYLLEWFYTFTGNYGLALILFGVAIKVILLPISMKSKKSMMKMSRLAPMQKAIQDKYPDNQQKAQMEIMALYKKEGVSPTGGCLWSLIPLLILIPLYQVIREPLVYMMHMSRENAQAVVTLLEGPLGLTEGAYYNQLAVATQIQNYLPQIREAVPALANVALTPIDFSFLGVNLGLTPSWHFWALGSAAELGLFLIPIISAASQWFSMRITQKFNSSVTVNEKGEQDDAAAKAAAGSMKTMNIMMPVMSLFIGYGMPAGMSIYWITQALFSVVQEFFLTKHYRKVYDAEDEVRRIQAAEEAAREAERERIRAERRAKLGDVADPNTSKKKLAAKEKAEKGPVVEGKLTPEQREALKAQAAEKCPSGIEGRPYARGRAYQPVRYGRDTSGPGGYDMTDELRTQADDDAAPGAAPEENED